MPEDTFKAQLNGFLDDVSRAALTSASDREKVNKAGAKALAEKIESATYETHRRDFTIEDYHLYETIRYIPTDIDGHHDGTSTVGFDKELNLAHIARFLNDGTINRPGDHFVDNARTAGIPSVVAAQRAAYQKIVKRKGG